MLNARRGKGGNLGDSANFSSGLIRAKNKTRFRVKTDYREKQSGAEAEMGLLLLIASVGFLFRF